MIPSEMPPLRLYNTLTRRKEAFAPIDPANVRMYVCGPTVYDFAHIGNARPVIVFDLLFRLLRHRYGEGHVTYVRNITDVDDKINARARAEHPDLALNEAIRRVTTETERQFHADIRALGVLMPEDVNVEGARPVMIEPRATEHIAEMRTLIDRLVAAGHAYLAEGHALFHVPSMPAYGGLSRRPLDEMEAGARVDIAPYKRSPLDFVLWKPSAADEPGWPGPDGLDGLGRPGWHIECSAMSWRHLGETFDIHGGGLDLIFPHHENEIAQSRCCFGTPTMATTWLHNGFLQVEGEKMSKSLGNFVTIRDVLNSAAFGGRRWSGDVVRLAMLKTHYRQPIDWTVRALEEAEATLRSWSEAVALVPDHPADRPVVVAQDALGFLADDLNTAGALSVLHERARSARRGLEAAWQLAATADLLGFRRSTWQAQEDRALFDAIETRADVRIDELVDLRLAARAAKNWAESDRIRDELAGMGIRLKDNKDGTTTWEAARS